MPQVGRVWIVYEKPDNGSVIFHGAFNNRKAADITADVMWEDRVEEQYFEGGLIKVKQLEVFNKPFNR